MKNVIIAILVALVLVFAFLFFTQKKSNVSYEPWPETEPATITPTTPKPKPSVSSTPTQTNQNNPISTEQNDSNPTALENIETPIYIKSIYQKSGKWWADVDYVTEMSSREYLEHKIQNDICIIPGKTKEQTLAYSRTVYLSDSSPGTANLLFNDSLLHGISGCYIDLATASLSFTERINQNPLIRSFPFASNFNTINYCPPERNITPLEIKDIIENNYSPYSYSYYNTKGYYVKKATIKDSTITVFNYVNGCAS